MTDFTRKCPYCGDEVRNEGHIKRCRDRWVNECPMCGQKYKSYTEHIKRCPRGD